MADKASEYATKIRSVSFMLKHCSVFMNVTKIHVCRPIGHNDLQKLLCPGHKRINYYLFCTVISTGDLTFFDGPVEGHRHDARLFNYTGLEDGLRDSLLMDGVLYYAHGDAAYVHQMIPWLLLGIPSEFITP